MCQSIDQHHVVSEPDPWSSPPGQHARSTFCLMVMSAADDSNVLTVTTGGVTHAPFLFPQETEIVTLKLTHLSILLQRIGS
jgi:hypothetical protein